MSEFAEKVTIDSLRRQLETALAIAGSQTEIVIEREKEIKQLQSKIAALSIAVADNDIDEVKRLLPLSGEQVVREMRAEAVDKELAELAKLIHYPECWDTMAYPTLLDALSEMAACAECDVARNQLRNSEQEKV